MKRMWIGVGLLAAMLALGIFACAVTSGGSSDGSGQLEQAARYAQAEDWSAARQLEADARQHWQSRWKLTAALVDHEPLEQIDSLFAQLRVYGDARDANAFSATAMCLAEAMKALSQSQQPTWWNLF